VEAWQLRLRESGYREREAGDRIVQNWDTASNAGEISDYSDWVVERGGFELPVPICEQ
jgi:phage terminase large subunit-like protein